MADLVRHYAKCYISDNYLLSNFVRNSLHNYSISMFFREIIILLSSGIYKQTDSITMWQ